MAPPIPSLPVGTIFADRYKIIELLGKGGMGFVYRAEHLSLRKPVALKVIRAAFVGEREQRFAREGATLAKLDHRGIVRILDYGRTNKYLFIAMDLVEGRSLRAIVDEGPMEAARAVRIARQILAALAHAHDHGVLHRDVKPENVMIGQGDRVTVIDFGLSRAIDDAPLTTQGMCYGSPSYLAPERLIGGDYDERADLYAVGIMMYEMLAGERPFPGANAWEILRRTVEKPARPLRAHRRDVPRWLETAIAMAMAHDAGKRYSDAYAMREALVEPIAAAKTMETEADATIFNMTRQRPGLFRRVWARLRFGSWRWENSGAV